MTSADRGTRPRSVMVTGGTGFIGSNLVRRLLADGHSVHLLAHPGTDTWRLREVLKDVDLRSVQLSDGGEVTAAVAAVRPDWIFHLAAYGSNSVETDPERMVMINVVGSFHLLRAARSVGCEALIQAGSSSEYGFKDHAPSEREWLEPNSMYAATKAAATLLAQQLDADAGATVATLRLYSIFGPYERPIRFIPNLILAGLEGGLPPLVDPAVCRDYLHVDDAVNAFVLAASVRGEEVGAVYNVGSGIPTRIEEVVEVARRVLPITTEPVWGSMPNRNWDTTVWVSDCERIRQRLGWRPSLSFEAGFRQTVEWFGARPELVRAYRAMAGRPSGAQVAGD